MIHCNKCGIGRVCDRCGLGVLCRHLIDAGLD
jgi:hypothetical protein